MSRLLWCSLIVFLAVTDIASTKRIKDMIYMSIDGVAACFRRHNGTHQFGCSSRRGGSVGVIQMVDALEDVEWLEKNATAGPYTAVMPFSMFTKDVLHRLRSTNNINGILLAKNSSHTLPSSYSPDDTCPNRYSGSKMCDPEKPWNPQGNNLLYEDWPFPMFYVENDTLLQEMRTCYTKHNAHDRESQRSRSLCALEMQSFMSSAVDSETCIRRNNLILYMNPTRFCDPLGDRNIHWPLSPLKSSKDSVTLVIARLDANSMFDTVAPGANSAVTALVTLLAIAYYMNTLNATVSNENVLFSLLNGEAFDYIGSSRFAYDLKEGNFNALAGKNLPLDSIKTVIELNQLTDDKIFLHTNNYSPTNDSLIKSLETTLGATLLQGSVPPTSIQSFLRVKPTLSTALIASYGEKFTNNYYSGILDNSETLGVDKRPINETLTRIAIKLGDVLYKHVTGVESPGGNESFIEGLISEMLSCYTGDTKCNLFRAASPPGVKLENQPLSLYVSVATSPNRATSLTGQLLALLTGVKMNMTAHECHEHRLAWMGGYSFNGSCINSTVNYTSAVSPAFIIPKYSMKSGVYSTWTESIWGSLSVRMFLKPSDTVETLSICLGGFVAGLSFIVVWFINSRAHILFQGSRTPPNC
ncbi:nicastrin [Fopius arisanus]|uniref:Nicastrin n=1 Tax=Fopius arisanus TaxID=64838 RepID=A0A0C9Q2S0_9HYME|nr:PREDICTED: nicastrin [Fopius arisanus]